jgi:hypothetical protein
MRSMRDFLQVSWIDTALCVATVMKIRFGRSKAQFVQEFVYTQPLAVSARTSVHLEIECADPQPTAREWFNDNFVFDPFRQLCESHEAKAYQKRH